MAQTSSRRKKKPSARRRGEAPSPGAQAPQPCAPLSCTRAPPAPPAVVRAGAARARRHRPRPGRGRPAAGVRALDGLRGRRGRRRAGRRPAIPGRLGHIFRAAVRDRCRGGACCTASPGVAAARAHGRRRAGRRPDPRVRGGVARPGTRRWVAARPVRHRSDDGSRRHRRRDALLGDLHALLQCRRASHLRGPDAGWCAACDRGFDLAADRGPAERRPRDALARGRRARTCPRRCPKAPPGARRRAAHRGHAPRAGGRCHRRGRDRRGGGRGPRARGGGPPCAGRARHPGQGAGGPAPTGGHERSRAVHAAGQAPLGRHRVGGIELRAARPQAAAPVDEGPGARHLQPGRDLQNAGGDARPLRHRGQGGRAGQRSPGHPPRAAACARHQGLEGHAAEGRHRLRARIHRHPHPGSDSR